MSVKELNNDMLILKSDKVLMIDVDDTIIKWSPTLEEIEKDGILYTDDNGNNVYFVPIKGNIEQLKRHRLRSHFIVVWSAGGYEWALTAVKLLKLESYVDLVMSKPAWVLDDLPASEFMPKSQWYKD